MEKYDEYSAWDLFRRGQIDQRKHLKIIERMIKENITDLISHGKIITGDNVVVPVKHLKQWRFVYEPRAEGTIVLPDGEKKKKGDIIGEKKKKGAGSREGGSGGEDSGHYEVVVNADKISEYLFENMKLPRLKKKSSKDVYKDHLKMNSISRKGKIANLQKRRTVYENIKRNAAKGDAKFGKVLDEDLRYKSHSVKKVPQDKIIAIFIRDRSASMDEQKKEMTRIMAFWFNQFLEYKYSNVIQKIFILFDTTSAEVPESDFYAISQGGGTMISTGLEVAEDVMKMYHPDNHNIYIFMFTDGDNFTEDNNKAYNIINRICKDTNLTGVCHIQSDRSYFHSYSESQFVSNVKSLSRHLEPLQVVDVRRQEDIIGVMEDFFGEGGG